MTTQEQIAVMQAYADGKKIQWSSPVVSPAWMDIDEPTWNWGTRTYRVKPEPVLPKTWEEFCKTHPLRKGEARLDENFMISDIGEFYDGCDRDMYLNKNILPSKELAKAMVALCQLIQLRDCYNDGWQPNWKDGEPKYTIEVVRNQFHYAKLSESQFILTFKTEELRDEFLYNFRDIIETAKPLI